MDFSKRPDLTSVEESTGSNYLQEVQHITLDVLNPKVIYF